MQPVAPGQVIAEKRKIFEELIESYPTQQTYQMPGASSSQNPLAAAAEFSRKMKTMLTGMEKAADGQVIGSSSFLITMRTAYQDELDRLTGGVGQITEGEYEHIVNLRREIKKMDDALKKVETHGQFILRVNLGMGQIKGEIMILPDKVMRAKGFVLENGLTPTIVGDASALKGEVGTDIARNILADISSNPKVKKGVFVDPLMLLAHPDFMLQEPMVRQITQNAIQAGKKTQAFMDLGTKSEALKQIPKAVIEQIAQDAESAPTAIDDITRLPSLTQLSHLNKINEAKEIQRLLSSGADPRQIPQLVRRINDYYHGSVMRIKDGRTELVIPTASRFNIRTFPSRSNSAYLFDEVDKISVSLDPRYTSRVFGSKFVPQLSSQELSLAGFRVQGEDMMISGKSAYLYQHSLGGFDLDDKALPIMSKYYDSRGRQRLAFMTLRQPTAYQESIAMVADLRHHGTIQSIFKGDEAFKELLFSDQKLKDMGYFKGYENEIRTLRKALKDKKVSDTVDKGSDLQRLEELVMGIKEKAHGYKIADINPRHVARLAAIQSPSLLGLDQVAKDGSALAQRYARLGLDPNKLAPAYSSSHIYTVLKEEGKLLRNQEVFDEVKKQLGITIYGSTAEEQAKTFTALIGGDVNAPGYSPGIAAKLKAIQREVLDAIQKESAMIGPEESIGMFSNRQSFSTYTSTIADQALLEATSGASQINAASKARLQASGMRIGNYFTTPASEAVDVSKAIGSSYTINEFSSAIRQFILDEQGITTQTAETVLLDYIRGMSDAHKTKYIQEMQAMIAQGNSEGRALLAALQSAGFNPQTMTPSDFDNINFLRAIQKVPFALSATGNLMLNSVKQTAYTRSVDIVNQALSNPAFTRDSVDFSKLLGFERELFFEAPGKTKAYSRVSDKDAEVIRRRVIEGFKEFKLELQADANLQAQLGPARAAEVLGAVDQQIQALSLSGSAKVALQSAKMFMDTGTEAYAKYAKHSAAVTQFQSIGRELEAIEQSNLQTSRSRAASLELQAHPDYSREAKAVISSIKGRIKSLGENISKQRDAIDPRVASGIEAQIKEIRISISSQIAESAIAIKQANNQSGAGGKTLDMIDTFAATLKKSLSEEKIFPDEVSKIMNSASMFEPGQAPILREGNEMATFSMQLFEQARIRNLAKIARQSVDMQAVREMESAIGVVESIRTGIFGNYFGTQVKTVDEIAAMSTGSGGEAANYIKMLREIEGAGAPSMTRDAIRTGRELGYIPNLTAEEQKALNMVKEFAGRVKVGPSGEVSFDQARQTTSSLYHFFRGGRTIQEAEAEADRIMQEAAQFVQVDEGIKRTINSVANAASAPINVVKTQYKRFSESLRTGAVGEALQNKGVRNGLIAAAALATFGFIYSAKKERGQQEMTGPPMLPGGSAYETDYPRMEMNPNSYSYSNPSSPGMQYKVYLNGSSDQVENLSSMLGGVVDGPINSTMYNSLPNLGQDPYAQVASRF